MCAFATASVLIRKSIDKVLVMEGGVLQEFDEPIKLLNNTHSEFFKLVSHTGTSAAEKLKNTAAAASHERADRKKNESKRV